MRTPNGLTVKCDGSNSSGQIDNYAWDWGDGSTDSGANKKHPSHKYNTTTDKTYTITLTVSNSGGSNSDTQIGDRDPAAVADTLAHAPRAPPASGRAGAHGGQRQSGGSVVRPAGRAGDAVGRDVARRFGRAALTPRAGRAPRRGSNIRA